MAGSWQKAYEGDTKHNEDTDPIQPLKKAPSTTVTRLSFAPPSPSAELYITFGRTRDVNAEIRKNENKKKMWNVFSIPFSFCTSSQPPGDEEKRNLKR